MSGAGKKRPDYRLSLRYPNGEHARVGAAWKSRTGGGQEYLAITLNPGVVLSYHDLRGDPVARASLCLFVADESDVDEAS